MVIPIPPRQSRYPGMERGPIPGVIIHNNNMHFTNHKTKVTWQGILKLYE